jgi:hypothetical protein
MPRIQARHLFFEMTIHIFIDLVNSALELFSLLLKFVAHCAVVSAVTVPSSAKNQYDTSLPTLCETPSHLLMRVSPFATLSSHET